MVDDLPDHPNIWTDGSREPIHHLDVEIAGAGDFSHSPAFVFDSDRWGHGQDLDGRFEGSSHTFSGFSVLCNQYKELNIGELSWLYKLTLESILASTI